jgi:hypothetical protein
MGLWSQEQDQELAEAVKAFGEGNWTKIANMVPNRTARQCHFRWMTIEQAASRDPTSRVLGTDETEAAITQCSKDLRCRGFGWGRRDVF